MPTDDAHPDAHPTKADLRSCAACHELVHVSQLDAHNCDPGSTRTYPRKGSIGAPGAGAYPPEYALYWLTEEERDAALVFLGAESDIRGLCALVRHVHWTPECDTNGCNLCKAASEALERTPIPEHWKFEECEHEHVEAVALGPWSVTHECDKCGKRFAEKR